MWCLGTILTSTDRKLFQLHTSMILIHSNILVDTIKEMFNQNLCTYVLETRYVKNLISHKKLSGTSRTYKGNNS